MKQAGYRPKLRKLSQAEERDLEARNLLVVENLEWARAIAAAVAKRLPSWFTTDDLVGPAEIGLIQAAERFDAAKNDSFRGYAFRRVHGACIASIRRREYRERAHFALTDTHTDREPSPEVQAQSAEMARVWHRVDELPAAHAQVIRGCYQDGLTLVEIAGRMGVSESWVCRLHRQGLAMLHGPCSDLQAA